MAKMVALPLPLPLPMPMPMRLYHRTIWPRLPCIYQAALHQTCARPGHGLRAIHTSVHCTQKLATQPNESVHQPSAAHTHTCYACNKPIEQPKTHTLSPVLQYCPQCNKLQHPINKLNYYNVFALDSYQYAINKQQLTKQYKALQRILHPDLFTNSTTTEQSVSADISSLVNTAYTVLLNDYSRAIYLLELNNIVWEKTNNSLNNSAELIYVMEIREQIDKYIDSKQYDALRQLNRDNEAKISDILHKLNETLSPNNAELKLTQQQIDQSLPYVAKLSYLIQIQQTIHAHLPST